MLRKLILIVVVVIVFCAVGVKFVSLVVIV